MIDTMRKLVNEVEDMKQLIERKAKEEVFAMNADEFELVKRSLQMIDTSCELVKKQTYFMEDLDRKLDRVLEAMEKGS